jgi:hypothetical protein
VEGEEGRSGGEGGEYFICIALAFGVVSFILVSFDIPVSTSIHS